MRINHQRKKYDGSCIICDTCILYEKEIETLKSDIPFALSWLSFFELFKTSETRPTVIINVWDRFLNCIEWALPFLPEQQFQIEVNKLSPQLLSNFYELQEKQVNIFDSYIYAKKNNQLSNDQWNTFLSKIQQDRIQYEDRYDGWLKYVTTIKESGYFNSQLNKDLKTVEGQANFLNFTKHLITRFFSIDPDIVPANFSRIELFTHVFNRYLIDFFVGAITPTTNDLIDVINMIYVRPGDKYWTNEKKWLTYIHAVDMNKYLFKPIKAH